MHLTKSYLAMICAICFAISYNILTKSYVAIVLPIKFRHLVSYFTIWFFIERGCMQLQWNHILQQFYLISLCCCFSVVSQCDSIVEVLQCMHLAKYPILNNIFTSPNHILEYFFQLTESYLAIVLPHLTSHCVTVFNSNYVNE